MYFPIAEIEVAWYIPPLAAGVLSFFTSMSGLSGAFLLLPFQIEFLHYTAPSVSATNQFYNIIAIPSGVYRYKKEKRFHLPLAILITLGALPGVALGVLTRSFLVTNQEYFKIYAACILLYLVWNMVRNLLRKDISQSKPKDPESLRIHTSSMKQCIFEFDGKQYSYKTKNIFFLSSFIAFLGGIYGIGGGAILAPFLVSYYGLPVYVIAGATLFCTFMSSCLGVLLFFALSFFFPEMTLMPDFMLGTLLGLGGLIGMTLGAKMQKYFPARIISLVIITILMLTAILWLKPLLG